MRSSHEIQYTFFFEIFWSLPGLLGGGGLCSKQTVTSGCYIGDCWSFERIYDRKITNYHLFSFWRHERRRKSITVGSWLQQDMVLLIFSYYFSLSIDGIVCILVSKPQKRNFIDLIRGILENKIYIIDWDVYSRKKETL